ncbi:hypothetical protein [Micromonospora sp. CPCC 206061]|uniref:hypothetical protein n=1 Tax=Micromonospora sp. CPCC 206061 TaxID=3122410 RepID=UPI002FF012CA
MSTDYPRWQPRPDLPDPPTHLLVNGHHRPLPPLPRTRVSEPARPAVPDDAVVRQLHEQAAHLLAAEFRSNTDATAADRRAIGEDTAAKVVRKYVDQRRVAGHTVRDDQEQALLDAVLAYLFGLGRLQAITDHPDVENVMVLGHDRVRVEYADGRVEDGPAPGTDCRLNRRTARPASSRPRRGTSAEDHLALDTSTGTSRRGQRGVRQVKIRCALIGTTGRRGAAPVVTFGDERIAA